MKSQFMLQCKFAKSPNALKVSDGSEWRDGCAGEGGGAADVTRTDIRSTFRLAVSVIWVSDGRG